MLRPLAIEAALLGPGLPMTNFAGRDGNHFGAVRAFLKRPVETWCRVRASEQRDECPNRESEKRGVADQAYDLMQSRHWVITGRHLGFERPMQQGLPPCASRQLFNLLDRGAASTVVADGLFPVWMLPLLIWLLAYMRPELVTASTFGLASVWCSIIATESRVLSLPFGRTARGDQTDPPPSRSVHSPSCNHIDAA